MEEKKIFKVLHKRISALILSFAMILSLMPSMREEISAASTPLELSYRYAADCQRSPAYPKKGEAFKASGFGNPLISYQTHGSTMSGSWKLISKGMYTGNASNYPGASSSGSVLSGIVSSISSKYGVSTSQVEVFELKNGSTHVAYGVLCGVFGDSALYIGDTWSGGGGYVLSNSDLSSKSSINGTITQDVSTGFEGADKPAHTCTSVTKVNGQNATCTADGWNAYYKCTDSTCNKLYSDASHQNEITNLAAWKIGAGKINKTGHNWSYTTSGTTINASCANASHPVSLTINVTDADYSGAPFSGSNITLDNLSNFNASTGHAISASQIKYYKDDVELDTVPTDAGTYEARLAVEGKTVSITFTISPKQVEGFTVTLAGDTLYQPAYNENEEKNPSIVVMFGDIILNQLSDYDLSGDTTATEVGEYTITITGKGNYNGTKTVTWKILTADFGAEDISASDIVETYDGNGHSIDVMLSGAAVGSTVTYSETENGEYTSLNPCFTGVTDGPKTIWYQVEKYGYNPVKKYATITINKRDILVKADDLTKHVGSGDPSLTFSVKEGSLVEGESLAMNATREIGENPAEYTITLSQEDGANTNYNITFETGTLTIEDHVSVGTPGKDSTCTEGGYTTGTKCSICGKKLSGNDTGALGHAFSDEYTVDKASTCLETGKKSRHCTRVGCDETTDEQVIEKSGHDWSGEWIVTQKATKKEEGKREKTCAVDGCNQKLIEKIPVTGEDDSEEDTKLAELIGNGNLVKEAEITAEAPFEEIVIENKKSELMEAEGIFTEAEKSLIKEGADARVWLEVDAVIVENIEPADQKVIEEAVAELVGEDAHLTYFDASLFKQVGELNREYVHEPGMDIEITISMPEKLINTNQDLIRKYSIIRLHENVVDTIEGTFNEESNEYTFVTDKFSVYAIAYKDFPRADLEEEEESAEEIIEDDADVLDEEIAEEEEIPADTTEDMVEEEAEEQDDDSEGTRVNPPKTGDYEGNPIIENHYMIAWKKEDSDEE